MPEHRVIDGGFVDLDPSDDFFVYLFKSVPVNALILFGGVSVFVIAVGYSLDFSV